MKIFVIISSSWHYRHLIWRMSKREVIGRYQGSFFGIIWSFMNPLLMLLIYTFVFGHIFHARWADLAGGDIEFSIFLFSGLIVHTLFTECITKSPELIVQNKNYVTKIVFPLEILPLVTIVSSLFHFVVSFIVLMIVYLVLGGDIHLTVLLLPLIILPLIIFTLGVAWFLAAIGVFIRDVGQSINIVTAALLFLSPIFYPDSALPESIRPYLFLNPLTFIIGQLRDIVIYGNLPQWIQLAVYFSISIVVGYLGYYWFQRLRKEFADVL